MIVIILCILFGGFCFGYACGLSSESGEVNTEKLKNVFRLIHYRKFKQQLKPNVRLSLYSKSKHPFNKDTLIKQYIVEEVKDNWVKYYNVYNIDFECKPYLFNKIKDLILRGYIIDEEHV